MYWKLYQLFCFETVTIMLHIFVKVIDEEEPVSSGILIIH